MPTDPAFTIVAALMGLVLILDAVDLVWHSVGHRLKYGEWPTWQAPSLPREENDGS